MENSQYQSVTVIAKKYGFKPEVVRNMCHARSQRFALRLVPNGKFYIDPVKFQAYIERRMA